MSNDVTKFDLARLSERASELSPSDAHDEEDAILEAANRIAPWLEQNGHMIAAVIQTYADGDAEELFEALREHFWARELKPFRRPK